MTLLTLIYSNKVLEYNEQGLFFYYRLFTLLGCFCFLLPMSRGHRGLTPSPKGSGGGTRCLQGLGGARLVLSNIDRPSPIRNPRTMRQLIMANASPLHSMDGNVKLETPSCGFLSASKREGRTSSLEKLRELDSRAPSLTSNMT